MEKFHGPLQRPSEEEPSARQRLLDAAEQLFYRHGIHATGVDAVLGHAGVARRTLYHQFGGKDGLTVAYLRARDERWTSHWLAALESQDGPNQRLLAIFDAVETWEPGTARHRGCAFIDALAETPDPANPVALVVASHWKQMRDRLTALAADAGVRDPSNLAARLMLVYRGALATLMVEPVDPTVREARTIAARLVDLETSHRRQPTAP